jgi:hypothetical protein
LILHARQTTHFVLNVCIALVWLINGLFCKVLNFVPRHQEIVTRILGAGISSWATRAIGVSEILMGIWILSRIKPKLCAALQIAIIATMNTIEYILAPDLLLFGKINSLVALFFISVIFLNEFTLNKRETAS